MNARKPDAIALLKDDHREVEQLFKEYEGLGEGANADKKRIAGRICTALTVHAMVEEEIFYPAVREAGKDKEAIVDEAVVEHASARELIAQLQEMDPEDALYDAKVKVLSEQIAHHIGEEEAELFPKADKVRLDLDALGQEMAMRKDELIATS